MHDGNESSVFFIFPKKAKSLWQLVNLVGGVPIRPVYQFFVAQLHDALDSAIIPDNEPQHEKIYLWLFIFLKTIDQTSPLENRGIDVLLIETRGTYRT